MKQIYLYLAIAVVISLALDIGLNIYKRKLNDKLMHLLLKGKIEEFDKILERKSSRFFVSTYSYHVLKLNKAVLLNDLKLMNQVMSDFSKVRANEAQKLFVYSKAFSFYLTQKDQKRVELCYKKICECKDCPTTQYIKMVYNTVVEKKYDYLEEALSMLGKVSKQDEDNIRVLISTMYQNKGEQQEALKYLEGR